MAPADLPQTLPTIEIDVDSVLVSDRIRRTTFGDIDDLAQSISANGLIQPIVVTANHRLIAGERRLRAHRHLGWKTIKCVYLEVLDEAHLSILEATENIVRQDFSWQERVLAIDKVHKLKRTESALRSEAWGCRETGRLLNAGKSPINRALVIAEYLHANDQEITQAESLQDAFRVLAIREENRLGTALVARSVRTGQSTGSTVRPVVPRVEVTDDAFFDSLGRGSTGFTPGISSPLDVDERPGEIGTRVPTNVPLSEMFLHGDAVEICRKLDAECFDAVITDWPYGIDMSNIQQDGGGKDVSTTAAEHDPEANRKLHAAIVPELYRILKPNSWFITWTDQELWQYHVDLCTAAGFKVQRWPLVWHKTSVCQNMAANQNFTKNVEVAIVCRKGTATLVRPQPSCLWTGSNDSETRLLGHPFAKPAGLWDWLYTATCPRGALVFDPFVGCGSSVMPAVRNGLRPSGCESNERHFNTLNVNLQNFYKSLDPTCTFS